MCGHHSREAALVFAIGRFFCFQRRLDSQSHRQEGEIGGFGGVLGLLREDAGGRLFLPSHARVHGGAVCIEVDSRGIAVLPSSSLRSGSDFAVSPAPHRFPQIRPAQTPSLHGDTEHRIIPSLVFLHASALFSLLARAHIRVERRQEDAGVCVESLLCVSGLPLRFPARFGFSRPQPSLLLVRVEPAEHGAAHGGGGRRYEGFLCATGQAAVPRRPRADLLAERADAEGEVPSFHAEGRVHDGKRVVALCDPLRGLQQPAAPSPQRVEALPAVQAPARGVHRVVPEEGRSGRADEAAQTGG